jgi:ferredoxin
MSVLVTFAPSGISGLVAEGTYLIDAARRMGVSIGSGCTGSGECPDCQVLVITGMELLSPPTRAESSVLGIAVLAEAHRLACQVMIERTGELVVSTASNKGKSHADSNQQSDLRKQFSELRLDKKIAMLLQFEAVTMSEAFDAAIEKPLALGTRALDAIVRRAKSARAQESQKKRPPEHQRQEPE